MLHFAAESRRKNPSVVSSTFAPMEVPLRKSCAAIARGGFCFNNSLYNLTMR